MTAVSDLTFGPVFITEGPSGQTGLFRAHKGQRLIAAHRKPGATPFVGASRLNNSITDFADVPVRFPPGWLTLIYNGDGGTGQARYQPAPFSASDDVIVLEPLSDEADEAALLLIASILTHQCVPKFGFGYKLTLHRLRRQRVMVPIRSSESGSQIIDWEGLSSLGRNLLESARSHALASRTSLPIGGHPLPELSFKPMPITDVFDTMAASTAWYDKVHLKPGPGRNIYLSQTRSSNGVQDIVANQRQPAESGNCITTTLKTQATFYQPSPFYTAQNFLIFRHALLDEDSAMILVTSIRRALEKFSWGYGVSMARLRKTRIMVPVKAAADGTTIVDWDGMRLYARILRAKVEGSMNAVVDEPACGVAG